MLSEKRFLGLIAFVIGLAAAVLILIAAGGRAGLDLLEIAVGIGVLYGSYLIYRGKTSLLLGWGKTRLGAMINLVLGFLTLLIPGGVGGTPSILAIVSGVVGLVSA